LTNTNVLNIAFALWSALQETGVKTFTMNIDTGLMQYIKSNGALHVRSVGDHLGILEMKASKILILYNVSRIGSDNQKIGDLRIKVEYLNKSVKILNTTAELVARDIYRLL